jgi:hypothetical protein
VGEAENPEPQTLKVGVAGAVGLEGSPVSVVAKAVGLHDNPVSPPQEVHLIRGEPGIHFRWGKAVAPTEG